MRSGKTCAALVLWVGLWSGCNQPTPAPRPPPAAALGAIVATCASAQGSVTERPHGAAYWEPVRVGSVFRVEDWVRTGELSFARVEFLSGGALELDPKTIVVIDQPPSKKPGEAAGPRVALQQGSLRAGFPETPGTAGALTPLRLHTADGRELSLAPEPGKRAEFRVEQRNGKTEIAVLLGAARVATDAGERSLVAGQFARIDSSDPGKPEELIAFPSSVLPSVDARFHGTPELSVELGWGAVEHATGYRVQVARDLSFQQLVVNEDVSTVKHVFRPGEMGMFAWRIASRDQEGRLGEFGFARRMFVELEQPRERLVEPTAGAVLNLLPEDSVTFRWEPVGKSGHYRFVLAKSADLLGSQVAAQSVATPSAVLEALAPGEYRWGVYVEDAGGKLEPIFLSARRLVVKRAAKLKVRTSAIRDWGG